MVAVLLRNASEAPASLSIRIICLLQNNSRDSGLEGPSAPGSGPGVSGARRHADAQRQPPAGAARHAGSYRFLFPIESSDRSDQICCWWFSGRDFHRMISVFKSKPGWKLAKTIVHHFSASSVTQLYVTSPWQLRKYMAHSAETWIVELFFTGPHENQESGILSQSKRC